MTNLPTRAPGRVVGPAVLHGGASIGKIGATCQHSRYDYLQGRWLLPLIEGFCAGVGASDGRLTVRYCQGKPPPEEPGARVRVYGAGA